MVRERAAPARRDVRAPGTWIGQAKGRIDARRSEKHKKAVAGELDEPAEVDLHGLSVEQALRRIAQALHAARVRRQPRLLVITGAGWGNPDQKPVLRPAVEAWLRGPEGRALGVKDVQRTHKGGALDVRLG